MKGPLLLQTIIARLEPDTVNSRFSERVRHAYCEWLQILKNRTFDEIVTLLEDPGEEAARPRHSSPFFGILSEEERAEVFRIY